MEAQRGGRPWRRRAVLAVWGVLVAGVFLLPYGQQPWWSFPASTLTLLLLFALRWRRDVARRTGLALGPYGAVATALLGLSLWLLFRFVLAPSIVSARGLELVASPPLRVAEFAFQALNEEIVLGYLLLVPLARWTRRPVTTAVAVALLFAVLHHLLYRYGELGMDLAPVTLLALLAVGAVRNAAILLARHVGYAWALHAAWNLVMFSGQWVETSSGRMLKEPEVLDAFLSPPAVIVPACVAAVVLLVWLGRLPRR